MNSYNPIPKLTLNGKWKPGVESSLKLYIISSCTLYSTETWTPSWTWLYNKYHHITMLVVHVI